MLPLPDGAVGGGLTPAAGEVQAQSREERPRFELGLDSKWVTLIQDDFCPGNKTNP